MAFRSELLPRFFLAIVVLLGSSPTIAAAQTADELIERGRALRQAHDDQGALALFQEAYADTPSPRALAQIGYAELALGRWIEGEAHVEEAFGHTDDAWIATPDAQAGHRAARGQIDRHVSALSVVVSVDGAEVRVGDRVVGISPLPGPVRVEVGETSVRANRDGYDSAAEQVTIEVGQPSRVELSLTRTVVSVVAPIVAAPAAAGRDDTALVIGAIGLATGGAALLLGIISGAVVLSNDAGLATCDHGATDPCASWRGEVRTAEALQWVGYAVGGALAVGGVIALVVHALSGQAETPSPSAFGCEPGISGVACHGRF